MEDQSRSAWKAAGLATGILFLLAAVCFFYYFNFGKGVTPCATSGGGSTSITDELTPGEQGRFVDTSWGSVQLLPPGLECTAYATDGSGGKEELASETYPGPIVWFWTCLLVLSPFAITSILLLVRRLRA